MYLGYTQNINKNYTMITCFPRNCIHNKIVRGVSMEAGDQYDAPKFYLAGTHASDRLGGFFLFKRKNYNSK